MGTGNRKGCGRSYWGLHEVGLRSSDWQCNLAWRLGDGGSGSLRRWRQGVLLYCIARQKGQLGL